MDKTDEPTAGEQRRLADERSIAELGRTPSLWSRFQSSLSITGLISLIVAALPVATFIYGWAQKERDTALEREKQAESARMAYLDRLKDEDSRERVLRFILKTSHDGTMRDWAVQEQKLVDASQASLRKEIQELANRINSNQDHDAVKAAQEKISELEARLGKPSGIAIARPSTDTRSSKPSIAQPQSPDATLPTAPPGRTGGIVPHVASECTQWSPPADLRSGQCRIACWDASQRSHYNVNETMAATSGSDCQSTALKRCQKAENSFCAFAWSESGSRQRFQGRPVSCDRASQQTTAKLSPKDQEAANAFCVAITTVKEQGGAEPFEWPNKAGLTFDTGHRIGTESVWCSCYFTS